MVTRSISVEQAVDVIVVAVARFPRASPSRFKEALLRVTFR